MIRVPEVLYEFDDAGNRTSMTDGSGSVEYDYTQLSQLESETREFAGLSGSFELSYEYGMNGALSSITDAFGDEVNYVGQRIVATDVKASYPGYEPMAQGANKIGDDSPREFARAISGNNFAWRDAPGIGVYMTRKGSGADMNDLVKLASYSRSTTFEAWVDNGKERCAITFTIQHTYSNGNFSATMH